MSLAIQHSASYSRLGYREKADTAFFADFQRQYQADIANKTPSVTALGEVNATYSERRGVSLEEQLHFAGLLNKAYSAKAQDAAKAYLQTMNRDDLAVLQRQHGLADPIQVANLSEEGAENLLLPAGWGKDLDGDGQFEVGVAHTMSFPPQNAPMKFKEAWEEACADLPERDVMTLGFSMMLGLSSIEPASGKIIPNDLPRDQLSSYTYLIQNTLDMLEQQGGALPAGQYEREKPFFLKLLAALQ